MRKTQVLVLTNDNWMDARWEDIAYEDLKKDHIFRLFEEDGTRVTNGDADVWIAQSDAYYNEHHEDWGVQCVSIEI